MAFTSMVIASIGIIVIIGILLYLGIIFIKCLFMLFICGDMY